MRHTHAFPSLCHHTPLSWHPANKMTPSLSESWSPSPVILIQGRKMPHNILGSKWRRGYGFKGIQQLSNKKRMYGKRKKRKGSVQHRKKPPIMKPLHILSRRTTLNKRLPWLRRKLRCLITGLKVCDTSIFLLSVVI